MRVFFVPAFQCCQPDPCSTTQDCNNPMLDLSKKYHPETVSIRHGHRHTEEQEHSEPLFLTSSFVFQSAAQAAARFSGEEQGNVYSRFTNPTVAGFEQRLAAMEGAEYCVATASGMAAITGLFFTILKAGDHVVASSSIFGTSVSLFTKFFNRFGVETTFVELDDEQQWRDAIQANTKLFFLESPSNPLCRIADIRKIADIAHGDNILLAVDNAFCTSALQQPFSFGADFVLHTATKYLDGQGRCVGGAILTNDQTARDELVGMMRTCGPSMSPFNAWTFTKGLETLSLRMAQHSRNAMGLARWLCAHDAVLSVNYPGLESHPQHDLAKKQCRPLMPNENSGFGGIVSFEVKGGRDQAWSVIDNTEFLSITANLGDAKTTITHPATTTHGRLTQDQRDLANISDRLIRVSTGLEHVDDIIADLKTGLDLLL